MRIRVTVNGSIHESDVDSRMLLSDYLRHDLRLTGTHVGCEHGVCGACTVLVDDLPTRACLVFAVQVDGLAVRTVESLAPDDAELGPVQQAMKDNHGLQCGFCTPGILMSLTAVKENPCGGREEAVDALRGHLCRCTGYKNICSAIEDLFEERAESHGN